MNDDKGTRSEAIEELDRQFREASALIWSGATSEEMQAQHSFTKEDEENPFLKPAIAATRGIDTPRDDEGTVAEAIGESKVEVDQE